MSHFQTILNRFFPAAADICNEILDFQPDLIICLMHSGRLPLYAGMQLWERTQSTPFPAVARLNLGREKLDRYDVLENRPRLTSVFDGSMEEDHSQAFFLAWLADQKHWQDELGEMVRETAGNAAPERILIVDDVVSEGATWMLAVGLLELVFPQAAVRFYNANIECKRVFLKEWIERYHPGLLASGFIPPPGKMGSKEYQAAEQMVAGTEDVDRESLRWRIIEPPSPTLNALSACLPAEDWPALPRFAEEAVRQEIAARLGDYIPDPGQVKGWQPRFDPGVLVLREIYRHGPLTLRELGAHLGWSPGKTRYQVDRQIGRGWLVVRRAGRIKRLALSPMAGPEYDFGAGGLESYWVIPGRLLAGRMPGYNIEGPEKEDLLSNLRGLVESGVTCFIHLRTPHTGDLENYQAELLKLASERGRNVRYTSIQIPRWRLPDARSMRSILDRIDAALEEGYTVYLHDDVLGEVTQAAIGCYLVRHGMTGRDALQELERLRKDTYEGWRRAPARESARRLVRRWAEGLV
jgi:hypothetical protein